MGAWTPYAERTLLLHVHVPDPAREASFSDIEVRYAYDGHGHSELLGQFWLAMPEGQDCPADWYESFY